MKFDPMKFDPMKFDPMKFDPMKFFRRILSDKIFDQIIRESQ